MVEVLVSSLILTIIIELLISILIGIREKNDIITIIAVNTLTNPIIVFMANILNVFNIKVILYWIIIIIMEIIVVFVEGKIYKKILKFSKISGLKLSFINNFASFMIGVIITILLNSNVSLRIEVASAFYPFTQTMLNSQEFKYDVKMKSTNEVYEDLISGNVDAIVATKPSDGQKKMIQESNINLEFKTIYKEPLAILINKDNNINDLSIEQIQNIYYNNLDWNTYQLEKNNGSQTCFESIVKNNELGSNHYEINTMPKIIDKIAIDKKSIGYAFYSYYTKTYEKNNVKIINVDSKKIKDEDYPLLFDVYLIYRTDNNNENISKIVDWIEKEEGQQFIKNIK